jgi:hypothetical protein
LVGCRTDDPFQHGNDAIEPACDIGIEVVGLLDVERRLDDHAVTVAGANAEDGNDRRAGVAGDPHRARRERRLAAEKRHRLPVLEKVAVGQEDRALTLPQPPDHASYPRWTGFDEPHVVRATQERDAIEHEARCRATGDRSQFVATVVQGLSDEIERAEVTGDDDDTVPGCERIVEVAPVSGDQRHALDDLLRSKMRNQENVGDVTPTGAEHVADQSLQITGTYVCPHNMPEIIGDALSIRL